MKQRLTVRVIVQRSGKTLLLRRAIGSPKLIGEYELPGGKIELKEQPEDAITRVLVDNIGVAPNTVQLLDVFSYIDEEETGDQIVFVVYKATINQDAKIVLSGKKYNQYVWRNVENTSIKEQITEVTKLLLGSSRQLTTYFGANENVNFASTEAYVMHSDGGSRGNPGPSAAGFTIASPAGDIIAEAGEYLGITTNNQAEYAAVRLGLLRAIELDIKTIECRIDSLLVVNQLNGVYTIKNRELWPQYETILDLIKSFEKISFIHVRREFNTLADGIVNKVLDEQSQKSV